VSALVGLMRRNPARGELRVVVVMAMVASQIAVAVEATLAQRSPGPFKRRW